MKPCEASIHLGYCSCSYTGLELMMRGWSGLHESTVPKCISPTGFTGSSWIKSLRMNFCTDCIIFACSGGYFTVDMTIGAIILALWQFFAAADAVVSAPLVASALIAGDGKLVPFTFWSAFLHYCILHNAFFDGHSLLLKLRDARSVCLAYTT